MPTTPAVTPARLMASATAGLPRWVLPTLVCAYVLAGLFGRDPWKSDDAAGVATMLAALYDGAWLWPQIGALTSFEDGPLTSWVGAAALWLAGPWLGELAAARLPNLLWFGLAAWALWFGTRLLGQRPEAQPLALPFGGEPNARDYGQGLADIALLLLLATAGILWRSHETSSALAALACQALAYLALAQWLSHSATPAATHQKIAVITLALALTGAFLTRGLPALLPLLIALPLALPLRATPRNTRHRQRHTEEQTTQAQHGATLARLMLTLALAALLMLAWWWPARYAADATLLAQWRLWHTRYFGLPDLMAIARTVRDLPWFLWPTWPLALVALVRWRAWLTAPHVRIPAALAAGVLVQLFFTREASEPDYMLLVVPCAALAAFAMPTLRRGVVNTLDWFALMCFSLTAATVWLGWIALHFGWPPKIAANIARQTSGFVPSLSWWAVLLAAWVTVGWAWLIRWRLQHRPAVLWRGALLMAGGLTATWLLLVLLWLPAVDYARSYRTVSGELAAVLTRVQEPGACLRGFSVGKGQRASLLVFDGITLTQDTACPLVLQQTTRRDVRNGTAAYSDPGVTILWQGARRADRNELLRLIRLTPKALSPVVPDLDAVPSGFEATLDSALPAEPVTPLPRPLP